MTLVQPQPSNTQYIRRCRLIGSLPDFISASRVTRYGCTERGDSSMAEPSSQENTGSRTSRKTLKGRLAPYSVFIRLSVALVCGLFFAFLATQIASTQWVDFRIEEILVYSSPLLIGIIAPLTIVRRTTYRLPFALLTGVFTWLGIYA